MSGNRSYIIRQSYARKFYILHNGTNIHLAPIRHLTFLQKVEYFLTNNRIYSNQRIGNSRIVTVLLSKNYVVISLYQSLHFFNINIKRFSTNTYYRGQNSWKAYILYLGQPYCLFQYRNKMISPFITCYHMQF